MHRHLPRASRARGLLARFALAATSIIVASVAHADGFAVGAGAGAARGTTDCVASFPCDHSGAYGKLVIGYGLDSGFELAALAFEAGRFHGGDTTPLLGTPFGGSFSVAGLALTAGYRWSFAPRWSLLGKAGLASVRTRFDYSAPFAGEVSKSTTQPLFGVGVSYDVAPRWRLSLDLDQTRFEAHETRGPLRLFGASVQYLF